jgi:DNA helicase-2/ATP-dependent DNA helicase PcrA
VVIAEAYTEDEEAQLVMEEVDRLTREEGFVLRDFVVTYRVNAQSRALEEACLRYGVPYKLVGGVRFYQRREVKDLLAYLRLLQDPYDEVSLIRVINVPTRGIGKRTVDDFAGWARSLDLPMYTAMQLLAGEAGEDAAPVEIGPFNPRQRQQLVDFLRMLNGFRGKMPELELPQLIDEIMENSGYKRSLVESDDPDAEDRLDNLREFRGVSADYEGAPASEALQPFLEGAALVSDQDTIDEDEQQYLTLITLHQIKGLEYPVVFMTGMEDGVLPHMRSIDDPDQLEEERRIAYVGMTRARQRLYLFRSFRRRLNGAPQGNAPSRFLMDVPYELTETPRMTGRDGRRRGPGGLDREVAVAVLDPPGIEAGPPPFQAGDKVTHAKFGQGIVVNCTAKPGDYEITVAFLGDSGIKRLLHSFAKLQKAE